MTRPPAASVSVTRAAGKMWYPSVQFASRAVQTADGAGKMKAFTLAERTKTSSPTRIASL